MQLGEGVSGLRRALRVAGARQLLMGLWSVPDADTEQLMTGFYRSYLDRRGGDAVSALTAAQRAALQRSRRERGESRPQDWGAWIVSGRPPG